MRERAALIALLLSIASLDANAVLIENGGPRSNETAPFSEPGWRHVGVGNGLTVVYLGQGWVLSAAHVGEIKVAIDGGVYFPIPGSRVVLEHSKGTPSDVVVFRIDPYPAALPDLAIRDEPVKPGELALLVGHGRDRGEALQGQPGGFRWARTKGKRWGTNHVELAELDIPAFGKTTRSFYTEFSQGGSPHEAQATPGDSGGPAFTRRDDRWELSGVMWGSGGVAGQRPETTPYGSRTFVADLSFYRDQIREVMTPACGNGHVTIDEECDDGNNVDGDCCSARCRVETIGGQCDDGLYCNGPDACNERGVCEPLGVDPCDDGDACTADACREPATCDHTPLTTPECQAP